MTHLSLSIFLLLAHFLLFSLGENFVNASFLQDRQSLTIILFLYYKTRILFFQFCEKKNPLLTQSLNLFKIGGNYLKKFHEILLFCKENRKIFVKMGRTVLQYMIYCCECYNQIYNNIFENSTNSLSMDIYRKNYSKLFDIKKKGFIK